MNITAIVKVSMQGVSRPYVCLGDDGRLYWCKGNHTGLRALMLEWLCAKIAQTVGLPVPECRIAKLTPRLFRSWQSFNGDSCPAIVTDANPYVFASCNVEAAKDVIDPLSDLRDVDPLLLAKVYMFDRFIRNTDRTDVNSNLLINGSFHVIDHNNALDKDFDADLFAQTHILRSFYSRMPETDEALFEQVVRSTVTSVFLESIWSEMPSEWTDPGESVLSLEDVCGILLGGNK